MDIQSTGPQATWIEQRIAALLTHRMSLWLYVSIALAVLIWWLAPHMVKVVAFKLSLMPIAGYVLYWMHKGIAKGIPGPAELWEEARQLRVNGDNEHGWQLEQAAYSLLFQRTLLIGLGIVGLSLAS